MKFETLDVQGFEPALKGMRNPMNSWNKSDSYWDIEGNHIVIGENDMKLCKQLRKAGESHRKVLRQIMVWVDITAPLYWYKEFDQYRVGVTTNSTSTMHKLTSKPITVDDFEIDDSVWDYDLYAEGFSATIEQCEKFRQYYVKTKDEDYWRWLIQLLPSSYLQTRTVSLNYENILNMYTQRKNHKLIEWSGKDRWYDEYDEIAGSFVTWAENLPYFKTLCLED